MNQPLLKETRFEAEVQPEPTGVGATLRGLREAKRLTPAEVSARLKFSSRQLEALETEQWDRLPTGMSLRGFVKNSGRYLETDIDALMVMLDNQVRAAAARLVAVTNSTSLGPTAQPPNNPKRAR